MDMASNPVADRAIRWWLIVTAVAVVATIAVGGATRLTESGLSITEWKPVTGVIPPMTGAAWQAAYEQYLLIPEARTVHAGITLSAFQGLYWWEWAHRFVARLVGLIAVLPFLYFWSRGRIRPALFSRLASLPLLVGAQGALGWYMVRSGLAERASVSPYRLVAHLSLALLIFGIAVWTAASLSERARVSAPRGVRLTILVLLVAVVVTMMSGGFVAGLDAGKMFNTFPLMGAQWVPDGYSGSGGWRNLFENPVAAQFNHRLLAMAVAIGMLVAWMVAEGSWPAAVRHWMRISAAVVIAQVCVGITTLLLMVPIPIAVAHQLGAVALLATLLIAGQRAAS